MRPELQSGRLQRGSALLLAMVILTLVATLAAGMVWQQQRAIHVEAAERARTQAAWLLVGALDWARLLLREDARSGATDHLNEVWAKGLAETRLSSFLAADPDPTATDGPEAFLSGSIVDLQARYNLSNLVDDEGKVKPEEVEMLQRLCNNVGVGSDTAGRIADLMASASRDVEPGALVAPHRLSDLAWLGLEPALLAQLEPWLTLLPSGTPVNVNTAPREVLAAVLGLDLGSAERLVQRRAGAPFAGVPAFKALLPQGVGPDDARLSVSSSYFEITGRLRLDDRVLVERSIVQRRGADRGGEIVAIQRERRSSLEPPS
jgi:general secretion pathway protein K